jgi:hypothetical protein
MATTILRWPRAYRPRRWTSLCLHHGRPRTHAGRRPNRATPAADPRLFPTSDRVAPYPWPRRRTKRSFSPPGAHKPRFTPPKATRAASLIAGYTSALCCAVSSLSFPTRLSVTRRDKGPLAHGGDCSHGSTFLATLAKSSETFLSIIHSLSYLPPCREPVDTHCGCP